MPRGHGAGHRPRRLPRRHPRVHGRRPRRRGRALRCQRHFCGRAADPGAGPLRAVRGGPLAVLGAGAGPLPGLRAPPRGHVEQLPRDLRAAALRPRMRHSHRQRGGRLRLRGRALLPGREPHLPRARDAALGAAGARVLRERQGGLRRGCADGAGGLRLRRGHRPPARLALTFWASSPQASLLRPRPWAVDNTARMLHVVITSAASACVFNSARLLCRLAAFGPRALPTAAAPEPYIDSI
mmetsp:Transcript_15901/g.46391  ORF Transcript_15901/g.46391 Transcript_15901/m.46391 type:complete len:240 (-) Transcript_15901:86-805(-)